VTIFAIFAAPILQVSLSALRPFGNVHYVAMQRLLFLLFLRTHQGQVRSFCWFRASWGHPDAPHQIYSHFQTSSMRTAKRVICFAQRSKNVLLKGLSDVQLNHVQQVSDSTSSLYQSSEDGSSWGKKKKIRRLQNTFKPFAEQIPTPSIIGASVLATKIGTLCPPPRDWRF
jgi:hypothetical protein